MLIEGDDTEEQNLYAEYIYTGDTSAAYDASKWEKLGEYKPEVDTSTYDNVVERVNNGDFSDVVNFDSISLLVTKPTITLGSAVGSFQVVFLNVTKTFVAVSAGKYYGNWSGAEAFGNFTSDGRTPKKNKIYLCDNQAYVWDADATELKLIDGSANIGVMSNEEIDALFV